MRSKAVASCDHHRIFARKSLNNVGNFRWMCPRNLSSDGKSKNNGILAQHTEPAKVPLQQKIIELNEEKLGKLKERILSTQVLEAEKQSLESDAKKVKASDKAKIELGDDSAITEEIAKKGEEQRFYLFNPSSAYWVI